MTALDSGFCQNDRLYVIPAEAGIPLGSSVDPESSSG